MDLGESFGNCLGLVLGERTRVLIERRILVNPLQQRGELLRK
jgi:hypothetical protein